MRINLLRRLAPVALACALAPAFARAQQTCQPPLAPPAPGRNLFTPQQEMDLGDAIAEQLQRSYRVVEDEALTAELRRIGARVVKGLPDTGLRFQFFLLDAPEANAFTLPGGRVYVARKLVAFVRSEDELAGILAHELGHVASRQTAEDMSYLFREVLGVTSVGDRRDIFEKYHQLVENAARKPKAFEHGARAEEKEQLVADALGLYALAGAGYDPAALPAFWERFTEAKGKGGFFAELFGSTKPEEKRLREMRRALAALPAACVAARASAPPPAFQQWQAAVVAYAAAARKEELHGVVAKTALDPPLRGDVTYLRFSPDGKYILAQDDTGINVLAREPFALRFRIDAPEAHTAQFTPDSRAVVFNTSALRVESWDVAAGKQADAHELVVRDGCWQTALAPDGRTLACLAANFDLVLYDVTTGAQLFQKKGYYKPTIFDLFRLRLGVGRAGQVDDDDMEWVSFGFSPDARYFIAGARNFSDGNFWGTTQERASTVIYDLTAKAPASVPDPLKVLLTGRYAFVGPDRIVARNPQDYRKSALVGFPGGAVLEQFALWGNPASVTRGDYFIVRPVKEYAAGVAELGSKNVVLANRLAAIDVYEQFFVAEQLNGELSLYRMGPTQQLANVRLPRNPLGRVYASAVSPDMRWLAVSERTRGAVWDLTKGTRVLHTRGFRGAHFAPDGAFYADFPKTEETGRTLAKLDPASGHAVSAAKLEGPGAGVHGPYLLALRPARAGGGANEDVTLEVRDTTTQAQLWTRAYPKEAPDVWVDPADDTLVLVWAAGAEAAKAAAAADPNLKQQLAALKTKERDYFLQVLDAKTGQPRGGLIVETGQGSFRMDSVFAAGDWVVVVDTENRVLVYALARGTLQGRVFGGRAALAPTTGLLAVENERGRVSLYELATLAKRDEFDFGSPVKLARFSADGRRLFVLTANQTAYVLAPERQ
ncbi:MAG TPA: M48 family metalloprotease [Pyrinomonadaceae bacterium]|jgi:hypothetical protein